MQLHRRLTVHVSVSSQRSVEPCIFVWVWKGLRGGKGVVEAGLLPPAQRSPGCNNILTPSPLFSHFQLFIVTSGHFQPLPVKRMS